MESLSSEMGNTLVALSNDMAGAVERAGRAVVAINARQRMASSGVYWRQGVVIAADHSIKREEEIFVTLPDGHTVPAALTGRDSGTDLAVLELQGVELTPAEVGDASLPKTGHMVLALSRSGEGVLSASLGIVSAVSNARRPWHGGQNDPLVRLDLVLYPGFSGGPLVDTQGHVIGINTSGLSRSIAFAIPTSTVNRVAHELLTRGYIARGYLGVGLQPVRLPVALKAKLQLPGGSGVIAFSVEPDGPAEKAGMLIGDVLVALAGAPVGDTNDLQAMLGAESVGKTLGASIIRGGNLAELEITVGERPRRGR
jgi:S1-C subfamily serine protease